MRRPLFFLLTFVFALACDCQDPASPSLELDAAVAAAPKVDVWPAKSLKVDQTHPAPDPPRVFTYCSIEPPGLTLQQTFTPTSRSLAAVDLPLKVSLASETVTVNVRVGAGGPVVGTASSVVPGPAVGDVRFAFRPPLRVQPGQAYAIELLDAPGPEVMWASSLLDGYAGGTSFTCWGAPNVYDQDFFFTTYNLGKGS